MPEVAAERMIPRFPVTDYRGKMIKDTTIRM